MTYIDTNHPFYRPLWVRLLIVAACTVWATIEFYYNQPFWGTIVGGIAIYGAYTLLYAYKPPVEEPAKVDEQSSSET